MRLSKLVGEIKDGKIIYGQDWEREIESLSADSRAVKSGALFFCLTGGERDGHAFASEAVAKGALAIVTERALKTSVPQLLVPDARLALSLIASAFYGYPSERMKVVGITGTNGKTTTANMLCSIWEAQGKKAGVIGTLGVRYGDKKQPSALTTPDPIELQKTLSKMAANGVECVAMEVSAHALHYNKTSGVRFVACIFTNLTQDHLDFFGTMREYENAKNKLFTNEVCALAIINGDDEAGRRFGVTSRACSQRSTLQVVL